VSDATDPLPTPKQREALCDLMHDAFVELRALARSGGSEQAGDLADAIHNLPKEMYGWGRFSWDLTRGMLADYERKWRGRSSVSPRDHVAKLDAIRRTP
jgi:hypothetical protein